MENEPSVNTQIVVVVQKTNSDSLYNQLKSSSLNFTASETDIHFSTADR